MADPLLFHFPRWQQYQLPTIDIKDINRSVDAHALSRGGAAPSRRGHQLLGRPGKGGLAQ